MNDADEPSQETQDTEPFKSQRIYADGTAAPRQASISQDQIQKARAFVQKWVLNPILRFIRFLDAHNGALTAAATVAIAALTWSLSYDSKRQADTTRDQVGVMKGQLDEMRAEQRPWLSAVVTLAGQYSFDPKRGGTIQFRIVSQNSGKTPAQRVMHLQTIFPFNENASEEANKIISMAENYPAGNALFPSNTADQTFPMTITMDVLRKNTLGKGPNSAIFLTLFGVVRYDFVPISTYHKTCFTSHILVLNPLDPSGHIQWMTPVIDTCAD